ncbi:MAG: quinone oxidoreductase [Pseudomonadota bacterium]
MAIVLHGFGGPEELRWESIDLPAPAPGEVQLRHGAVGMNLMEVGLRVGGYPGPELPFVPGVEGAGVVVALGDGVDDLKVGDRVGYAAVPVGSYCEVRNFPADRTFPLPEHIDDRTAAACMVKGMTAEYMLKRCYAVKPGDKVLIHAAAGATGMMCVQLARHLGAEVFGTVSSKAKADYIKSLGCDHAIVYTETNFADEVLELTNGDGVNVVYDSIGQTTFNDSLRCLHYLGSMCLFGIASGPPEPLELMGLDLLTSQQFVRPSLYAHTRERQDLLAIAAQTFDYVREGVIKVDISQTFVLKDAADAHRAVESRKTTGSLVLLP